MLPNRRIEELNSDFRDMKVEEILTWVYSYFDNNMIAFATSMGAEDQVLADKILKINKDAQIFTIDTGRMYQETYDLIEETNNRYGIDIEVLFPEPKDIKEMVKKDGPNLFYKSGELRKKCCMVRKVKPLTRKLSTLDAWIVGLCREQSLTRSDIGIIGKDESFGLVKIAPLANWTIDSVWSYIQENRLPSNALHDKNYPSIGCVPCTRAVEVGEDIRAGRWWWEQPEHKECGLHIVSE